MAYIINDSRGQILAIVPDGTINTTASPISLVGRGVIDYGVAENENYVFILENFAKATAPNNPLQGQLWFNTSNSSISVRNIANGWTQLANVPFVEAQKESPQFTGVPRAPTAPKPTANTQLATTEFVQIQKESPQFTGAPASPTAPIGTNTYQQS